MSKLYMFILVFFCGAAFGQEREIAITIDDLPLVASKMNTPANEARSIERFTNIVNAFKDNQVPVTGFVIAGAIEKDQWAFLQQFRDAGFELGNHTYSHPNLNGMSAEKYIADVDRADKKLSPILTSPKYFRYPYLAEGNKKTKPEVMEYLTEHGYTVAPVTIDSKDYAFNERVYRTPYRQREKFIAKIKQQYLDFIWKQTLRAEKFAKPGVPAKQILLLHANLINSYLLNDVLQMYKQNGYKFISLTEALQNPAPEIIFPANEKVEQSSAEGV